MEKFLCARGISAIWKTVTPSLLRKMVPLSDTYRIKCEGYVPCLFDGEELYSVLLRDRGGTQRICHRADLNCHAYFPSEELLRT